MTTKNAPARSPRGYLLVEVLVGAMLAASVMGGVMIQVGQARDDAQHAARERSATELVLQRLEQGRALGFTAVSSTSFPASEVVTVGGSTYRREFTVAGTTATPRTETVNGLTLRYKEITVTVKYPANGAATTTQAGTFRVYQ